MPRFDDLLHGFALRAQPVEVTLSAGQHKYGKIVEVIDDYIAMSVPLMATSRTNPIFIRTANIIAVEPRD